MRNFVKCMNKTGRGFEYLRNNFPNVSDAKFKECIFIVPQITKLMQDKQFYEDLNETERNAWLSLKRICKDFLGNHKAANYQDVVQDLLTTHKATGCNKSLKIHFWILNWIFFSRTSQRSQWRTLRNISPRHIGYGKAVPNKWTSSMLADYCWTLTRDIP